jgi:hypothetical protein
MTIAPEVAERVTQEIYESMLGSKSSFRLWGVDMEFESAACGCCMMRVIGFCLENRPKKGDVVCCSENCPPAFRGKLVFDGKNWHQQKDE